MNRKQCRAAAKLGDGAISATRDLLAAGLEHHKAGRLDEAERLYHQILSADARHADCLHLLGVLARQRGHLERAVEMFNKAIAIKPDYPEALYNLGLAYQDQGQLAEAVASYKRALALKPDYAKAANNLGNALRDQGRLAEAVASYRRALVSKPDYSEAHGNLGNALRDDGRLAEAVASYQRALALRPDFAEFHDHLGMALKEQGKLAEAVASYQRALALKADNAEVHTNLGIALSDLGKLTEAVASYERALALRPGSFAAHSNLGSALREQGKLADAVTSYQRALALRPDCAEVHSNLGHVLCDQGKFADAAKSYERAIVLKPDFAEAHRNLGNVLTGQGKIAEAVASYQRALALNPHSAEAHGNLGNALRDEGRLSEAVASYQRALACKPDFAEAANNLGIALRDQGRLAEAVASYERALTLKPDFAEAYSNMGMALSDQGSIAEAVASYQRALTLKPDFAEACSNLALCLNYRKEVTATELFTAHRDWHRRFGRLVPISTTYNKRKPERRLKVGYVSPNFREHSVAFFIEPLLREHDRQVVEVHCYAEVARPDAVTARLQAYSDHWLATVGLSDDDLAERIRTDGIDILVDLAGHTGDNRLRVFARKPAPVQVTWLGYPNTTGLDAIDYRLVDAVTDPFGEADVWASETLVRLEGGFLCYAGPTDAPEPTAPLSSATDTVTFGSFNNPAKVSDVTLDAWATLLGRLSQSRLLLKGRPFADAATRALFLARLDERGVAAQRVELVAWLPSTVAHLALYHQVDIALDPFPYNGTTTTCEALWMGVPVVTLRGDRHCGRVGASLLSQIGQTDWIAGSLEEYLQIAATLAGDPAHLKDLRHSLRSRIVASPLCDATAFARKIEAAYRTMWATWVRHAGQCGDGR